LIRFTTSGMGVAPPRPTMSRIFALTALRAILDEILEERVVSSRKRTNPRGVKRKMSNYPLRPRKRQRTRRIDFAKRIRIIK
jgi:hypothetical protein